MAELKSEVYARVLKRRANRLGVPIATAERISSAKPMYLVAAEKAANRLGTTPEAVLQEDLRRLENSSYPTANCLTPDELEDLLDGLQQRNLSIETLLQPEGVKLIDNPDPVWAEQLGHLATCDPCRTLLVACLPSEARKKAFEDYVGKVFQPSSVAKV
jgi:hypothetical protein